MFFGRDIHRTAILALVAIAVIVNFARPAPFASYAVEEEAIYAAISSSELDEEDNQLKCPCPTEVEKMDCDEGMCSLGLVTYMTADEQSVAAHSYVSLPNGWRAASRAPEPDPPRVRV